jgi:hypothetical protein
MQQDSKGQHRGQILGKVEPWVSREKVCWLLRPWVRMRGWTWWNNRQNWWSFERFDECICNIDYNEDSNKWHVDCQGNFECYTLEAHPKDPYAAFLLEIENPIYGRNC